MKIARSERHFNELKQIWDQYFPNIIFYSDALSDPDNLIIRAKMAKPPPRELATIIGDAVHNLRTALDQLVCELVRRNGGPVTREHAFPISHTQSAFEARRASALRGMSPKAQAFIRKLKPFQGGNRLLWMLSSLDNLDKHDSIVPIALGQPQLLIKFDMPGMFQAPNGNIMLGGGPPGSIPLGFGWGSPIAGTGVPILHDDCELVQIPNIIYQAGIPIEFDLPVALYMGPTPTIQQEDAFETLADLLIYVEKLIYLAERHLY